MLCTLNGGLCSNPAKTGKLLFHYRLLNFLVTFSEELLLDDINSYKFLTNGHVPVTGVSDLDEFDCTQEAFDIMSMTEDSMCKWQVTVLINRRTLCACCRHCAEYGRIAQ